MLALLAPTHAFRRRLRPSGLPLTTLGLGLDRMSERRRYDYDWALKEKRFPQIA